MHLYLLIVLVFQLASRFTESRPVESGEVANCAHSTEMLEKEPLSPRVSSSMNSDSTGLEKELDSARKEGKENPIPQNKLEQAGGAAPKKKLYYAVITTPPGSSAKEWSTNLKEEVVGRINRLKEQIFDEYVGQEAASRRRLCQEEGWRTGTQTISEDEYYSPQGFNWKDAFRMAAKIVCKHLQEEGVNIKFDEVVEIWKEAHDGYI